jgi:uncharacterized protein YbjT (DUF2867 family)
MNYMITGSLGNISKPVVKQLIAAGNTVTVISSNAGKKAGIEALGAKAAIGSIMDREFLKQAFAGADAVYLMIPPNWVTTDFYAYQKEAADNYVYAVKENNIKHVVQLSSIGAHLRKGAGPIDGLGYLEEQLETLKDTHVKMLRPSYFYANLHSMGGLIKHAGIMGSNFGSTGEKAILVHTDDIAAEAAKHLLALDFKGQSVTYIASDERHPNEIAEVLSKAINKPNTPWVTFSDDESLQGMLQAGLSKTMAEAYTQMGKAFREGLLQEDYFKHKTIPAGKIKLEEFAKEFAAAYAQS